MLPPSRVNSSRRPRPGTIKASDRRPRASSAVMMTRSEVVQEPARQLPEPVEEEEIAEDVEADVKLEEDVHSEAAVFESPEHRKAMRLEKLLDADDANIELARELCWTGVPQRFRATLWLMLMGIVPTSRSRRVNALGRRVQEYQGFVRQHYEDENLFTSEQMKSVLQIDLDLPRTSPGLNLFHLPIVQKSLRRVLGVYAFRHPATGYVQGMNDLATPFFYVFISDIIGGDRDPLAIAPDDLDETQWMQVEAYSFWCLSRLIEGIQDHYTRDQPGIQWKLISLERLVETIDPILHQRLVSQDIMFSFFAYRWMNCFLMRELSLPLIVRLWDTYMSEDNDQGFTSFHVYVCAAFLLRFSDTLKLMDMENILSTLQNDPTIGWSDQDVTDILSNAKRFRVDPPVVHPRVVTDDDNEPIDPCLDTIAAIRYLLECASRPRVPTTPPFILKHHLYDVLDDRCQVDQEIDALRRRNVIRLARIGGSDADHGQQLSIMFFADMIAFYNARPTLLPESADAVLGAFLNHVLGSTSCRDLYCDIATLARECFERAGVDSEQGLSVLFAQGLVVRRDASSFWFAVPHCGEFVRQLLSGRQQLMSIVKRRPRKDRIESALLGVKLRGTAVSTAFIIRDLICLGRISRAPLLVGDTGNVDDQVIEIRTVSSSSSSRAR